MSRAKMYDLMNEVRLWNIEAGHMRHDLDKEGWQDVSVRVKAHDLIQEEVNELFEAIYAMDQVETLDALADILFTVFGLAAKSGHLEILEEGLGEVINSNWTKIDGTNTDPTVKVGKPEGYRPPDLESIVKRAQKNGVID